MEEGKTLLIGYGSRIRGDDAAGLVLAEEIRGWQVPGLRVVATPQLYPELAHEIAGAVRVIFLDAAESSGDCPRVTVRSVKCDAAASRIFGHAYSPESLLAMSQRLYHSCPQTWIVTIPGFDFDWKDGLSPNARAALPDARKAIINLVEGNYEPTPNLKDRAV